MPKVCLYCARFPSESFRIAPLGLGYMASFLLTKGLVRENEIRIVDSLDEAIEFAPDILGVSSVSQVIKYAQQFARRCKEAIGCVTVLGGYHISCIPRRLPEEFDIGVIGEGEETFAQIVAAVATSGFGRQEFGQIHGICHRINGTIAQTAARELMADIDDLPWPYRHRSYSSQEPIFTSRGCPYKCTFCASHAFWKDNVRFRSAASVVDEIAYLVDAYGPEEIAILDDLWMAQKDRFREIVQRLVERRIPEKVKFNGFCRSNLVHEEDILLFKQMNYRFVRFGAETGSPRLLQRIKGRGISVSDHQRVIDLCFKHGIPCGASFMFGVPAETREDLDLTVQFLRKNKGKCRISGFYLCNPIPGTEMWRELSEKGKVTEFLRFERLQLDFLRPNFSWDNLLYFNEDKVPLREFRAIIENIRHEFVGPSARTQGGHPMPQEARSAQNSPIGHTWARTVLHREAAISDGRTAPEVRSTSGITPVACGRHPTAIGVRGTKGQVGQFDVRPPNAKKNWNLESGERQTAPRIQDIRRDHLNRYEYVADYIKSHSNCNEGIKVLDIFCGNGYGSYLLAGQTDNAIIDAIDGSAEAIEFARQNFASERVVYHHGIFPFMPDVLSDSAGYDYIVSLESIEHVEDDKGFYEYLLSKLKGYGVLFLSFPNKAKLNLSKIHNRFHFRHYDLSGIRDLVNIESCRVEVLQLHGQDVYALDRSGRTEGLLDESSMALKPDYQGQFLVVTLRKTGEPRQSGGASSALLRLEVGCGPKEPRPGFVGVDIRPFPWVKYLCNAWEMDGHIQPSSVAEIYSRHFFEHLTFPQADLTLEAWKRVLVHGGRLQIIVPDIEYHVRQFLSPGPTAPSAANPKWTVLEHALAGFWGWQRDGQTDNWDVHKSGYDYRCLKTKLCEHGFSDVTRVDDEPWNLNVICRKPV